MPRIPTRLYGPALVATGPATVYTVAASQKVIVRQVHIQNPSASPVTFTLSVGADAAATRMVAAYTIPGAAAGVPNSIMDFYWYLPLEATEIIQLSAGTNNILNVTITGDVCVLG